MIWQMWLFLSSFWVLKKKTHSIIVALLVKLNDDNINNWIITISRPNIEKKCGLFLS